MILVDTSVWVEHLRKANSELERLLESGQVLAHPFVIGELALGGLRQRDKILDALRGLPEAIVASHEEVMSFIFQHKIAGLGIGYVDTHLLASVRLMPEVSLWTYDKCLIAVAMQMNVATNLAH